MRALLLLPFALSLALSLALNASCLRQTEFQCTSNAQCGSTGTCQLVGASVGYCSFPDSECGQRFGESAGPYANQCVGTQGGGDGGVTIDGRMIDGPPMAGCPAGYNPLPNAPTNTHRYMKAPADKNWNDQVAFCMQTSPTSAYLAVPDDAAELTALFMLAGGNNPFWVGLSDNATEGTFVPVRGTTTFLPFATGQGTGGTGENCVAATGTSYSDEKCTGGGSSRPAVCECEP